MQHHLQQTPDRQIVILYFNFWNFYIYRLDFAVVFFYPALLIKVLICHMFGLSAVADAVRTSLGPKGMDKMVSNQKMSSV